MTRIIESIQNLLKTIELEKKDIVDDFNHGLIDKLQQTAGQTLYQLTRGEEGIRNHLSLSFGELYNCNPQCDHNIVEVLGGFKCTKCEGWFCY